MEDSCPHGSVVQSGGPAIRRRPSSSLSSSYLPSGATVTHQYVHLSVQFRNHTELCLLCIFGDRISKAVEIHLMKIHRSPGSAQHTSTVALQVACLHFLICPPKAVLITHHPCPSSSLFLFTVIKPEVDKKKKKILTQTLTRERKSLLDGRLLRGHF